MDKKTALDTLRIKLQDIDPKDLSISDLTGITILHLLQDEPATTVKGECVVTLVDDKRPEDGWKCNCYTNNKITRFSFKGPGFPNWVSGEDGGIDPKGRVRFAVTDPESGQIFYVVANCGGV